jgi:hypothetical protein
LFILVPALCVFFVFECLIFLARRLSILGGASNRLPGDWSWVGGAGFFGAGAGVGAGAFKKLCANRVLRLKTKDILIVYVFDFIKKFRNTFLRTPWTAGECPSQGWKISAQRRSSHRRKISAPKIKNATH